jgi:hypothetical protein
MEDDLTPYDRLMASALTAAVETVTDIFDQTEIESEDARLLVAALRVVIKIDQTEYNEIRVVQPNEPLPASLDATLAIYVIVHPPGPDQVDLAIQAYDHTGRLLGEPGWRRTVVEIDLTPQAAPENAASHIGRGKRGQSPTIIRMTADEIAAAPWDCARRIVDWASQGFGF